MSDVCGYAVVDSEGFEGPCDRPATGWRWYQNVEHEDCLEAACSIHENEGGRRMHAAEEKLALIEVTVALWEAGAVEMRSEASRSPWEEALTGYHLRTRADVLQAHAEVLRDILKGE